MPFNNEDKIPFKDLPVCHQQEVIDVVIGKYNDRELHGCYGPWSRENGNININSIYKVVQKDIIINVQNITEHSDGYVSLFGKGNSISWPVQLGKYKLVKIEE